MVVLKRFICNLCCVPICPLFLVLPVEKSVLLISILLETCGLGGWGFGIACYETLSVLELLPAPQNCLAPREKELITFKGFFMVAVQLFLPR